MTKEEKQEFLNKGGTFIAGDYVNDKHVDYQVGNVEPGGVGIQINNYEKKPTSPKPNKKSEKKPSSDKPKTLKYYTHGNNGKLKEQRRRVLIIYRWFIEWNWIDDNTSPDDFDAFFEGEPRHCNITWTANSTILTILLQELLQQPYIQEQKGCSAKSLVEQQFGKTANSDRKRLGEVDEQKIELTLIYLDTNKELPLKRGSNKDDEYDESYAAAREVYAGYLRSTKGI